MLQEFYTVLRRPGLLKHHQPVFLLSHMRANTSLLGHILGSNPEIAGYYEMHIGYYSWRSFIRQKLIYYRDHPIKPDVRYLFDKVLHDFHEVDIDLLNVHQAKVLFSIREPEQTIRSIVSQFRRERPGHEFCDVDTATKYYISRISSLQRMAERCTEYYFYDADDLRESSAETLVAISDWLNLSTPLSEDFQNFHFSGKLDAGDLSGNLQKRQVVRAKTDYSDIHLEPELLNVAKQSYQNASAYFNRRANSKN